MNQLRAFEAAARHGSFKEAADELFVTHAAVSHQIKALEADLGVALFQRLPRGVRLLPEAQDLMVALGSAFDEISGAVTALTREQASGKLRISCLPAFGYRFLLPRMDAFHTDHPQISVELVFDAKVQNLEDGFDGAIRYGRGRWPGLDVMQIRPDNLVPATAPAKVAGADLPMDADDILSLPYAVSPGADEDWGSWCAKVNAKVGDRPNPVRLENRAVVLDFLLVGSGIALVDIGFAAGELAEGKLVRLHESTVSGVNSTFLVWPSRPMPDPKLIVFGEWLRREANNSVENA